MQETVTCPKCDRHLELPTEYLGQEVQCPRCSAMFIAGEARQRPTPLKPEAISEQPLVTPPPPLDDEDAPLPRRTRRMNKSTTTPTTARGSNRLALVLVGSIAVVVVACGTWSLFLGRGGRHDDLFVDNFPRPIPVERNAPVIPQAAPLVNVPDRLLTVDEQKEHAKNFFAHFSAVMRNQNLGGEVGAFSGAGLLDTLFQEKLIPDAWQAHRGMLANTVQVGVLQTSPYRGEHWVDYDLRTIKHPRPRELIVVTRHTNRPVNASMRLRWWLVHQEGRWLIREMEFIDYGIRLSLLLAADLQTPEPGLGAVHADVRAVRDAANAVMIRGKFDEAERHLDGARGEGAPNACGATKNMLLGAARMAQGRFADSRDLCDAAELFQHDLPGGDYLLMQAHNTLRSFDLALQHGESAREWFGDEHLVCHELGFAFQGKLRFAEAAASYRKALDDNPDSAVTMAQLLMCLGPNVKNDDIADRFLRLKNASDHFDDFAKARWGMRDASTVQILAEAMQKRSPRHADAHYYLALAHAEQQRIAPALQAMREAIKLQDLDVRRNQYYAEFAHAVVFRENGMEMYQGLPDRRRSFRSLADAFLGSARQDELQELIQLHVKDFPKDEYAELYQGEFHLRDEQFEQANQAFTRAFAKIQDPDVENRFRRIRIQARYHSGDIVGAYRDIGPPAQTFQQLADMCWLDKKGVALAQLVQAHTKKDPEDPQLPRAKRRALILEKRYADAAKILAPARNPIAGVDARHGAVQDFFFDMIDVGQAVEAYRQTLDMADAVDIIALDLKGSHRLAERDAVYEEHRKRFPKDAIHLMHAGEKAAEKNEWAKAAQAYVEGWKELGATRRLSWARDYLFARFKAGQAVEAYQETEKRVDHFRMLTSFILAEKQTDLFEKLLEAHRPQRGIDPQFGAFDARLKILRGKADEAAVLLNGAIKNLPIHEQRAVGDQLIADLGAYDNGAEVYRCLPDKRDAFSRLVWRLRTPERVKELDRLIAAHAKHDPDDPRLPTERGEAHLLKKEFELAEKQFKLAQEKDAQFQHAARTGLMRARVKLGKAVETYHEFGANLLAFQDVASQCVFQKEGIQLERVLEAHQKTFPKMKDRAAWQVEVHFQKKDYAACAKAIQDDRAELLKKSAFRWKCEGYLVRSLVRMKKADEAVMEAETLTKRKDGPQVLLALALGATGEPAKLQAFFESKKEQRFVIESCYRDEDLGPILRSDAYRAVRERFPPPPEGVGFDGRFDDWD